MDNYNYNGSMTEKEDDREPNRVTEFMKHLGSSGTLEGVADSSEQVAARVIAQSNLSTREKYGEDTAEFRKRLKSKSAESASRASAKGWGDPFRTGSRAKDATQEKLPEKKMAAESTESSGDEKKPLIKSWISSLAKSRGRAETTAENQPDVPMQPQEPEQLKLYTGTVHAPEPEPPQQEDAPEYSPYLIMEGFAPDPYAEWGEDSDGRQDEDEDMAQTLEPITGQVTFDEPPQPYDIQPQPMDESPEPDKEPPEPGKETPETSKEPSEPMEKTPVVYKEPFESTEMLIVPIPAVLQQTQGEESFKQPEMQLEPEGQPEPESEPEQEPPTEQQDEQESVYDQLQDVLEESQQDGKIEPEQDELTPDLPEQPEQPEEAGKGRFGISRIMRVHIPRGAETGKQDDVIEEAPGEQEVSEQKVEVQEDGEQDVGEQEDVTEQQQLDEIKKGRAARKEKKRKVRARSRALRVIGKVLFYMICLVIVSVCVLCIMAVVYLRDVTVDDEDLLDLNALKLSFATRLMAMDPETGEWMEYQRVFRDENRVWVNFDEMPGVLLDSVVASEDHGFWEHNGVDLRRTAAATINMVMEMMGMEGILPTAQGGSTITQQLIKNITDEKNASGFEGIQRKLREIYRAYQLERRFTKDQILEAYLNTFRLGGQVAGIEAAANYYFGITASELTAAECAAIVSITKNPSLYDPFIHPEENKIQRDYVLYEMMSLGMLTETEYRQACKQADDFIFDEPHGSTNSVTEIWSYFTDTAVSAALEDLERMYLEQGYDKLRYGSAFEAAEDLFFNGGLTVYLTVDLYVQSVVEDVALNGPVQSGSLLEGINEEEAERLGVKATQYHDRKPIYEDIPMDELEKDADGNPIYPLDEEGNPITRRLKKNQVQNAIVVMNYEGELLGVAGGIYRKEASRVQNRAVDSKRQTGSSMKPLGAYCLPLEHNAITFSTGFRDVPTEVIGGRPWPRNYDYGNDPGLVSVAEAVERSLNTIAVQAIKRVGVDLTFDFLTTMVGISSLSDPADRALGPLSLGSMTYGISPYEMTAAYSIFGNDGTFTEKHCYTHIVDSHGDMVLNKQDMLMVNRALSPETAMIMNRLLQGVCLRGTATNARPGGANNPNNLPYGGKTGTTSDNKDYWIIGLNPYFVCSIWEGYDEPEYLSSPFAIKPIQKMFRTILARISCDKEYKDFPTAEGVVTRGYCRQTGDLASGACSTVMTGYYKSGFLPGECQHDIVDLIEEPVDL